MNSGAPFCAWCLVPFPFVRVDLRNEQAVVCPKCGETTRFGCWICWDIHSLPIDVDRWIKHDRSRHEAPIPPSKRKPQKRRRPKGTVYLVGAGTAGPVKIGFTTKRPEERLAALQNGSPDTLHLLGTFAGTEDDERQLHRELLNHRVHGEWFKRCRQVIAAFEARI